MKILRYAKCRHITTDEATDISCDATEIKAALKVFDKTIDVPRVDLTVNGKTIYLYNFKYSSYKRASLQAIVNVEEINTFCCERISGKKRIQSYSGLFTEIKTLLK